MVIHEYMAGPDTALCLGDRLKVVDNGDPDWLYGFKVPSYFNSIYDLFPELKDFYNFFEYKFFKTLRTFTTIVI